MPTYIYSQNPRSAGAASLAQAMGIRRIRHENSRYVARQDKKVINWGSSQIPPNVLGSNIINKPENVALASNKLSFFQAMSDQGVTPEFTTSQEEAIRWVRDGHKVVARTMLTGHSGAGIVMMDRDNPESLDINARLYVKYIKKLEEYRVHIVGGEIIDVQQKKLRRDFQGEPNWGIRSHNNGFVFTRQDVHIPPIAENMCIETIQALGLDFGAVDVIYNRHQNRYYVLEVNTAPGLEGTTITNYARALQEI